MFTSIGMTTLSPYPILLALPLGKQVRWYTSSQNSSTFVSVPKVKEKAAILSKGERLVVWERKIELTGKGHSAEVHCVRVGQFPPHHSCSIPVVPWLVLLNG